MTHGSRWWNVALGIALVVLAVSGCRKDGGDDTTIVEGSAIFTTDDFPGASVQDGNVADDRRAFSHSGEDFILGSLQVTHNGSRGTAMATYRTANGLFASHYDGTWTPPVKLQSLDSAGTVAGIPSGDLVVHAFINTGNSDDDNAQARDGDCLLLWRAVDLDGDGASTSDGVNTGLFATYFDVTNREDVAQRHGFQEFAARIDLEDEAGEDVTTFGIVTDGICGEARWTNTGGGIGVGTSFGGYVYGQDTTAIVVFARQNENNDGDVAIEDVNFQSVRFDPAEVLDEALPLTPSAASRLAVNAFGASNSGTDSQETLADVNAITYNGLLFTVVGSDDAALGAFGVALDWGGALNADDDFTIQYYLFDLATPGVAGPTHLHPVTPDSTDTVENAAAFISTNGFNATWGDAFRVTMNSVFGSDEGLACAVIYYAALVQDLDGESDFGDPANDSNLYLAQISESTGGVIELGAIGVDDSDFTDTQSIDWIDTRISRNGDYIWIATLKGTDQVVDELDLYVSQYITTRPDGDGLFTVPPLASSVSLLANLSPDTNDAVSWFLFQGCLGYVCGSQSDPDVMRIYWEESAIGPDDVYEGTLTADLVVPCVPGSATTLFFPFDNNGDQPFFGFVNAPAHFSAADAGRDGESFTVYREDYDGTVGVVDYRLTADVSGPSGGLVELTSGSSQKDVVSILKVLCTPAGEEIGVFNTVDLEDDEARSFGAAQIHVMFHETETQQSSGLGNAFRTRVFNTGEDDSPLGERFEPVALASAFELPFDLDLPGMDPDTGRDAFVQGIAAEGGIVGVWFTELSRLYYQEYNPESGGDRHWINDDDISNPLLVDDDNDEEIQSFVLFAARGCTCDTLSGAVTFWTKAYGSGSGGGLSERLQVRVRE